MKPSHIATAAIAALVLGMSAPAFAAPNPLVGKNYSNVTENGSANHATVDQAATGTANAGNSSTIEQIGNNNNVRGYNTLGNPDNAVTGVIQKGTGGTLNKSEIYQKTLTGGAVNGNEAAVVQDGAAATINKSTIKQYSNGNTARVIQGVDGLGMAGSNSWNTSDIKQQGGTGNVATVRQHGDDNTSTSHLTQDGSSHIANVKQYGTGNINFSTVSQSNADNHAEVTQYGTGNDNEAIVVQTAPGSHDNYAEVTQRGSGNDNYAEVRQNSSGNTAIVLQEGTSLHNWSWIQQSGGANTANVHQH